MPVQLGLGARPRLKGQDAKAFAAVAISSTRRPEGSTLVSAASSKGLILNGTFGSISLEIST